MQEKTDIPELLTVKEIQAKMRISKAGVYNLINSGQIPLIKIGNRKLIPKKEFLIWLKEQEVNTK
jgi:excisionase family DNA binding protein